MTIANTTLQLIADADRTPDQMDTAREMVNDLAEHNDTSFAPHKRYVMAVTLQNGDYCEIYPHDFSYAVILLHALTVGREPHRFIAHMVSNAGEYWTAGTLDWGDFNA